MVLLILHWEVSLAAQRPERQQAGSRAGDRGDSRRLQTRGVGRQLNWRPVSSVGKVLRLELLLLQVDIDADRQMGWREGVATLSSRL